ncbi:hypothetical protein V497_00090 [Pseudogymnoascus sp. VKM F-4516 (FW-969)]|nr:hypothetical protein V497_00090 [Pseudogymnoascus sp. VKM F-4516 (FW-969)]
MASVDDSGLTRLGPLTALFTPPASCLDLTVVSISTVYSTALTVTSTISGGSDVSVTTIPTITTSTTAYLEKYDYILDGSCYPPNYTTASGYYSPGLCPSAWEGVVTTSQNDETTVQCCPASFTFSGELCRSSLAGDTTSVVLYQNDLRVDSTPTPSSITGDYVWATGIVVRYRDGDFAATTDAKPSSTAKTIATPTDTPTDTPTAPASSDSDSGLSLGAKVGLGVGIPVAALILAVLAFLFFRRRRATAAPIGPQQQPQELHAYSQPPPPQYFKPMEQSLPTGYWETKPADRACAAELYAPSPAGSPDFGGHAQPTGYTPVAQVGAYAPVHEYGHDAGGISVGQGYGQEVSPPSVASHRVSAPAVDLGARQWSGGGGPLPDPTELYPEYGAAGDDDDNLHGGRR